MWKYTFLVECLKYCFDVPRSTFKEFLPFLGWLVSSWKKFKLQFMNWWSIYSVLCWVQIWISKGKSWVQSHCPAQSPTRCTKSDLTGYEFSPSFFILINKGPAVQRISNIHQQRLAIKKRKEKVPQLQSHRQIFHNIYIAKSHTQVI